MTEERYVTCLAASVMAAWLVGCSGGGGSGGANGPQPPPPPPPPAVTVALSASSTTLNTGQWTTLTWTSTNATTCTASGGWSGSMPPNGSQPVGPVTQSATYTLECSGAGGATGQASATVTANAGAVQFSFAQSWDGINDVVWDPVHQVLYLAIGSAGNVDPNTVTAFDPVAGTITASVWVCSEPNALGISDNGQYLYVGCAGTDVLYRYDLPALILGASFPVSQSNRAQHGSALFPSQLAVAPGSPLTVAIATATNWSLPNGTTFAIFDDQTARPVPSPALSADMVVWGADSTRLFAAENFGSIDVLSTSSAATSLVGTVSSTAAQLPLTLQTLTYSTGRLYNDGGDVFDATTLDMQAVLPTAGLVTVDPANQTVFVASWNTTTDRLDITSYDQVKNAPLQTITVWSTNPTVLGPGIPRRMVRWGVDGLAIVDIDGRLAVLWGPFVASGGAGSIVGTIPGTNPCCTQNPLQFSPTVNITSIIANDIAWDSLHGLVLASIPSTDPSHPDTIAVIDPATDQVTSYVATADNPGALAVSDDGQYLYVGEPKTYQRFLLPGLTLDATYAQDASGSAQTTLPPLQITVRPGDPHTVTVLSMLLGGIGNEAWYVYTDGVDLGIAGTRASWLQWSADGTTLYGSDGYYAGYPTLWSNTFSNPYTFTSFGTPFSFPIGENSLPVLGLTFTIAGGLFYSGSGAIYDPSNGGWPGTLPLLSITGANLAVGALAIDTAHQRAYSATCTDYGVNSPCGNALISVNLSTYAPVVVGPLPGVYGLASRLLELSPSSFVMLTSSNQVVFVSSPSFAL